MSRLLTEGGRRAARRPSSLLKITSGVFREAKTPRRRRDLLALPARAGSPLPAGTPPGPSRVPRPSYLPPAVPRPAVPRPALRPRSVGSRGGLSAARTPSPRRGESPGEQGGPPPRPPPWPARGRAAGGWGVAAAPPHPANQGRRGPVTCGRCRPIGEGGASRARIQTVGGRGACGCRFPWRRRGPAASMEPRLVGPGPYRATRLVSAPPPPPSPPGWGAPTPPLPLP